MFNFTWFDLICIFLLLAAPFVLGGIVIALLVMGRNRPRNWAIVKWLVLPQIAALMLLAGVLDYYGVSSRFYYFIAPVMMVSMLFFAILPKSQPSVLPPLICGHITGLVLFLGWMNYLEPRMLSELKSGWEIHQLRDLSKASDAFIDQLDDPAFLNRMLETATQEIETPEVTLKSLLDRGAIAFGTPGQGYFDQPAFIVAVRRHNLPALRLFSEQLVGNSAQAARNRAYVLDANPLSKQVYFYASSGERQKREYREVAEILLAKMPELLNDEVWARMLQTADPGITRFLWERRAPEKRLYRLQAQALMGDISVAEQIHATPDILDTPAASEYPATFWHYLVQYAPHPVIAAVLDKTRIRWVDYRDDKGNNTVLESAIDRARSYTGDDPQVLTLVMRDMLKQRVAWSPAQIAHGFYTEEQGSQVVSALYQAGMTCQQLQSALDNYTPGHTFQDGRQRLNEVCASGK